MRSQLGTPMFLILGVVSGFIGLISAIFVPGAVKSTFLLLSEYFYLILALGTLIIFGVFGYYYFKQGKETDIKPLVSTFTFFVILLIFVYNLPTIANLLASSSSATSSGLANLFKSFHLPTYETATISFPITIKEVQSGFLLFGYQEATISNIGQPFIYDVKTTTSPPSFSIPPLAIPLSIGFLGGEATLNGFVSCPTTGQTEYATPINFSLSNFVLVGSTYQRTFTLSFPHVYLNQSCQFTFYLSGGAVNTSQITQTYFLSERGEAIPTSNI
jgi:hypothetical protein